MSALSSVPARVVPARVVQQGVPVVNSDTALRDAAVQHREKVYHVAIVCLAAALLTTFVGLTLLGPLPLLGVVLTTVGFTVAFVSGCVALTHTDEGRSSDRATRLRSQHIYARTPAVVVVGGRGRGSLRAGGHTQVGRGRGIGGAQPIPRGRGSAPAQPVQVPGGGEALSRTRSSYYSRKRS